jgi:hypothetical protein
MKKLGDFNSEVKFFLGQLDSERNELIKNHETLVKFLG